MGASSGARAPGETVGGASPGGARRGGPGRCPPLPGCPASASGLLPVPSGPVPQPAGGEGRDPLAAELRRVAVRSPARMSAKGPGAPGGSATLLGRKNVGFPQRQRQSWYAQPRCCLDTRTVGKLGFPEKGCFFLTRLPACCNRALPSSRQIEKRTCSGVVLVRFFCDFEV